MKAVEATTGTQVKLKTNTTSPRGRPTLNPPVPRHPLTCKELAAAFSLDFRMGPMKTWFLLAEVTRLTRLWTREKSMTRSPTAKRMNQLPLSLPTWITGLQNSSSLMMMIGTRTAFRTWTLMSGLSRIAPVRPFGPHFDF